MGYYSEGGMNPNAPNCGEILVLFEAFTLLFFLPTFGDI
jgi:hypothetical protein